MIVPFDKQVGNLDCGAAERNKNVWIAHESEGRFQPKCEVKHLFLSLEGG